MEFPYALDVEERETSDDGFSAGWGAHFQPNESYWVDCHTHMHETKAENILDSVRPWGDKLDAWRFRRTVAMDGYPSNATAFEEAANEDDRFRWLARLDYDDADLDGLKKCLEAGASGLKLHNKPVIEDAVEPSVWQSNAWHNIFDRMGEAELPILWHVTQRLTGSPYTGGGRNSYWKTGWENGAEFDNRDLMDSFTSIVETHRDTDFIGAHQLHVGFDRLDELLSEHPNLYFDTSIGMFVRWGDQMYQESRERAREFFLKWSDRILFGTDCILKTGSINDYLYQHFLGHVRYIRQLRLPQKELEQVSHHNTERLMNLEPADIEHKGALRP